MAGTAGVLDYDDCWTRLKTHDLGRVAVVIRGNPFVFPVNYLVHDDVVVFRTGEGAKLDGVFTSPSVALEIDGIDPATGDAWSVIVVGQARMITDPDRRAEVEPRMPASWAAGDTPFLVEIHPDEVSGRLLPGPQPAT
ncbi:MAG: pyridoxamine 5'-phosphate oxidase family protein [Acidimicrobiia bacterium]|nr:pyridoxamine 5'-phosphate oxidase family protein [Acidimicrobiia bacterium]